MRICAIIEGSNVKEMLANARNAAKAGAKLVELRLNSLENMSDMVLLQSFPVPVIVSNPKGRVEEKKRIEMLRHALKFGPEFVDIEFAASQSHLNTIKKMAMANGIKIILSYHNTRETPSLGDMKKMLLKSKEFGYAKILTHAKNEKDLANLKEALSYAASKKIKATCAAVNNMRSFLNADNFMIYTGSHDNYPSIHEAKKFIGRVIERDLKKKNIVRSDKFHNV